MSLARCFDGACGPWGYCDASVGKCICAPGRGGADCSELLLGACRVHEMGEMACMTFTGLMSCECRLQCERRFGGVARRWAPVCWDYASPEMRAKYAPRLNLSDFPDGLPQAAVTFRSPSWPPLGRCAKPDPPRHCVSGQERTPRRTANILGGWPLANRHCPQACSWRGTCIRPMLPRPEGARDRFPIAGGSGGGGRKLRQLRQRRSAGGSSAARGSADAGGGPPTCICHAGYSGTGCETVDPSRCFNRCSGHGRCAGRFCLCDRGWQGVDCSLRVEAIGGASSSATTDDAGGGASAAAARRDEGGTRYTAADAAAAGRGARGPYAPVYVYPLPTDMSMEGVYQRDQHRRGQYYANVMFLEQLHARGGAVADPEEAALFFVPVMVMQMAGNLWHPYDFLTKTAHYLAHAHPYWNRTGGTDHVFFLTTDRGGCWRPWALEHSLIISYLGFRASEGYFGFEERLMWPRQPPNSRNNAYSVKKGSEALGLDCYTPDKDVVVPVDAPISPAEVAKLPAAGAPFACKRGPHKVLLYMGGSLTNMGRVEYSQGVRQAIQTLHKNESAFVLGGQFTLDDLRAARFCLTPSGWGWGWRLSLAIVTQCVPVIIQPNVTQPYEDLLEGTPYAYSTFAVRYTKEDIPSLPQLLRNVPEEELCAKQAMLARIYRAFLWQQPHGAAHASAYDMTQILLCRRAKRLAALYRERPDRRGAYLARRELRCADSLEAAGIRFD